MKIALECSAPRGGRPLGDGEGTHLMPTRSQSTLRQPALFATRARGPELPATAGWDGA